MRKRTLMYAMHPRDYEITCDKCGGSNIYWSEYEHMIWCYDCQIDTRGNPGIFDGPIPMEASRLLGTTFDKINVHTGELYKMHMSRTTGRIYWKKTGTILIPQKVT